jgi:hypothetical protein
MLSSFSFGTGRCPIDFREHAKELAGIQNLYSPLMAAFKPVDFRGSALDDLRAFPQAARYQLDQVQHGRLEADEYGWSRRR